MTWKSKCILRWLSQEQNEQSGLFKVSKESNIPKEWTFFMMPSLRDIVKLGKNYALKIGG